MTRMVISCCTRTRLDTNAHCARMMSMFEVQYSSFDHPVLLCAVSWLAKFRLGS